MKSSKKKLYFNIENIFKKIVQLYEYSLNNKNNTFILLITIALSVGYLVEKNYHALVILYTVAGLVYLLGKKFGFALGISIILTNLFLSLDLVNVKEGLITDHISLAIGVHDYSLSKNGQLKRIKLDNNEVLQLVIYDSEKLGRYLDNLFIRGEIPPNKKIKIKSANDSHDINGFKRCSYKMDNSSGKSESKNNCPITYILETPYVDFFFTVFDRFKDNPRKKTPLDLFINSKAVEKYDAYYLNKTIVGKDF